MDPVAMQQQLAAGQALVAGTPVTAPSPRVVQDHSYAVRDVYRNDLTGLWYVVLYNPWGTDGGSGDGAPSDGLVTLDWATFAANFWGYAHS
jgi:hypothetical protein